MPAWFYLCDVSCTLKSLLVLWCIAGAYVRGGRCPLIVSLFVVDAGTFACHLVVSVLIVVAHGIDCCVGGVLGVWGGVVVVSGGGVWWRGRPRKYFLF